MIRHDRLMEACIGINDAALIGYGWAEALEALARAAGSRGVMIMHNRDRKLMSFVSDRNIAEPVEDYLAGKAPLNARQNIRHDFDPGFRLDYDDFDSSAIGRDPYYQDWLRPIGLHWHANARLMIDGTDEIAISFKRDLSHGHYESADKLVMDEILPHLRASARVAECVFDAESRGMARALHQRGRDVLEFNSRGNVRRQYGSFDGSNGPLIVRGNQVLTVEPHAQADLTRAIGRAARPSPIQSVVHLNDVGGYRYFFQLMPVLGRARDVFFATTAVGILIGGSPASRSAAINTELARALFDLTFRELQIAGLLCDGASTQEIATKLEIGAETVQFHLKSVFEKTGGRRRSEVVALLAQIVH